VCGSFAAVNHSARVIAEDEREAQASLAALQAAVTGAEAMAQ
jgi:hypothetical protein